MSPEPTPEPIRVGIIGLGRSGWDIHASALAEMDEYDVVAVADPVAERRAEADQRFGCATHAEPDGLIDNPDVELVVVATPSHTHVPLAVDALGGGKHVLVEKPMAPSVADLDIMTAAADKADRVLTGFQNARFDPMFLAVRSVIDSGRLGELVLIRRNLHRFARRADWQTLRKFGGGELPNTASHLIDQVLLLLDDGPLEVFADLRRTLAPGDAEDHVKLCLRAATGPTADIESTAAVATPQPAWMIAGTAGGIVSTPDGLHVRWHDPTTLTHLHPDEGAVPGRRYGLDEHIEWHTETIPVEPPGPQRTVRYYHALARTLRHGAELHVTPASIRRQIDTMERTRHQTGFR